MFGYLTIHPSTLPKDDVYQYRLFYCGLCRALSTRYGTPGRNTLSYDMTFLAVLLSSLYPDRETRQYRRCLFRPFSRGFFLAGAVMEYAADMNILLAYHQQRDDWHDDHNRAALRRSRALTPAYRKACARRPRQARVIETCLAELSQMEAANELNADRPANCFGRLLGEVFVIEEDKLAEPLRQTGAALGRFIYLLDAANDFKADIKRERYNPLIAMDNADIRPTLLMLMGECTDLFEQLPIHENASILRNVLYAGVWTRVTKPINRKKVAEGEAEHGKSI